MVEGFRDGARLGLESELCDGARIGLVVTVEGLGVPGDGAKSRVYRDGAKSRVY